ncbi:hypothetical protein ALQ81_04986 [Pseudomonas syringae pv. pisi]|nr:hypothetical protein ALQ81_04986 [Pseudomonas syringae pv. pisi]
MSSWQGQVSAIAAGLVFGVIVSQAEISTPIPSATFTSGVSAMRWSAVSLFSILGFLAITPATQAAQDYGILIISRERLEVATSCEIGIYVQDRLAGRLFQEDSVSFNLPAGEVSVRLSTLRGNVVGCEPGMEAPRSTKIQLRAGDILKYRIAADLNGMYLKKADLNY